LKFIFWFECNEIFLTCSNKCFSWCFVTQFGASCELFCWIYLFGIYLVIFLLAITRICPLISILQRTIVRTKHRSVNIHNLILILFWAHSLMHHDGLKWSFTTLFIKSPIPFNHLSNFLKVFIKLTFFWMICNYVSVLGSVG